MPLSPIPHKLGKYALTLYQVAKTCRLYLTIYSWTGLGQVTPILPRLC